MCTLILGMLFLKYSQNTAILNTSLALLVLISWPVIVVLRLSCFGIGEGSKENQTFLYFPLAAVTVNLIQPRSLEREAIAEEAVTEGLARPDWPASVSVVHCLDC